LSKEMDFDLVAVAPPLDTEGKPRIEGIAPKMAELKATGIDFVYLGSSPFLDVNRDAFTGAAVENSLPVLSSYKDLVRSSQALISVAARGYDIGRLAGAQAEKILVGGPPGRSAGSADNRLRLCHQHVGRHETEAIPAARPPSNRRNSQLNPPRLIPPPARSRNP
jgi:hypothetical protein